MIYPTSPLLRTVTLLAGILACAATTQAANIIWTGAIDTDWTNPGNWQGGVVPANNDYQDVAVFGSTAVAGTVAVGSRSVGGIRFETSGWELTGTVFAFKSLYDEGGGLNIIANLNEAKSSATYNVVGSSTILQADRLRYYNQDVKLAGGGTLYTTQGLISAGFSSPTFTINDGLLRIDDNTPHQSGVGVIHIGTELGFLELETSNVSAVMAMFGSQIIDDTGLGLQAVYDGVQYTRVSAIPEPSTWALMLGASMLVFVGYRRKRR